MGVNWKALFVCAAIIPLIAAGIVVLLNVSSSYGGNIYMFSGFTGILLMIVSDTCEASLFNDSVVEAGNYKDTGIVLFISGMTPFMPFFNPVDVVPLLQFLWNLKS